ncbi:zinc finger, CCHC-type containing protein, partial [Tanacetum coccineum]
MLLMSLSSSYENFVETLLYERESLTMEDVLATLNSRELKKRTKSTKEDTGDRLYVRGRSDHSGKAHSGGSSQFKSRGETGKLKCFICHSEGHMKRDCPLKKSSWFVRKGKHDQDSDSSDDEGGSYHMTHRRDFLYDFKGTIEKEGYTMKMQMGRIKVIKGCRVMITRIKKKNRVYTFKAKVMNFGVQEHGGSKHVGLKQLGSKQVGFKQLGHKQVGPCVETGVHGVQVSNDDVTVAQRRLKDKQLKEKTNTACLVKEQEKVHLGIKVRANIMVTGVPGQEGGEEDADADEDVSRKRKRDLNVKMNSLRDLHMGYTKYHKLELTEVLGTNVVKASYKAATTNDFAIGVTIGSDRGSDGGGDGGEASEGSNESNLATVSKEEESGSSGEGGTEKLVSVLSREKFSFESDHSEDNIKAWIMNDMSSKWKCWKYELKKSSYDPTMKIDEIVASQTDDRVETGQFRTLVESCDDDNFIQGVKGLGDTIAGIEAPDGFPANPDIFLLNDGAMVPARPYDECRCTYKVMRSALKSSAPIPHYSSLLYFVALHGWTLFCCCMVDIIIVSVRMVANDSVGPGDLHMGYTKYHKLELTEVLGTNVVK